MKGTLMQRKTKTKKEKSCHTFETMIVSLI